ncbi:MAG: NAD-glutamate dehydrogenase domain-containing protein [Myxococcota bacterium]
MLSSASTESKNQIRSSLSRWTGSLPDSERSLFDQFVDETLNRLRGPFLAHHPPTQVLVYLEEAFRFVRGRVPGQTRVDIRPRQAKGVAVLVAMDDQPFIVDTIRLFLRSNLADYWGGFNLVYSANRDAEGRLVGVGQPGGRLESLTMLEADSGRLVDDLDLSRRTLQTNLEHGQAMVQDFKAMTRAVERTLDKFELMADRQPDRAEALRETAAFLKWLMSENFVFMGLDTNAGEPLGIQRLPGPYHNTQAGDWPVPHFPGTVFVRKGPIESPVHRAGRIDEIFISIGQEAMEQQEVQLFIRGMFTYRAVTQPSRNVPILRKVLGEILVEQSSEPGSFRYKGIANVFDSLPTEFLFTANKQAIAEMVDLVFEAEQQQEVGVTFIMNTPESAFCLVAMPKSQFGDELRRELEREIIATTHATYSDHGLFIGRYETVLLHYYLTGVTYPGDAAVQRLTERIRQLATPWLARIWVSLAERFGEQRADRLADTYGRAFPPEWIRTIPVERTVRDIEMLEQLSGGASVSADVFELDGEVFLRIYQTANIVLSQLLPVLSNFGLRVLDAQATPVTSRGGKLHIDTFRLPGDRPVLLRRAGRLTEAITHVLEGQQSNDRLNGLVLSAGLSWTQVDVVRAYARYSRQLQIKVSLQRMTDILLGNPELVCACMDLFHVRFDPDLPGNRTAAIEHADEVLRDLIRLIVAHDEDLVFSALRALIKATVRTNAYRTDRPHHYLSLKFRGRDVRMMGKHPPMYEIYVHSRDVEGVHLRFGEIARGGLRWSDRDDFRTEVLGLVTTQQVKNVVIVPTGSKGGFFLKNAPKDWGERRKMADQQYQTFIRGLLDVTDNIVEGQQVAHPRVVVHDDDGAYLVVAADKGTSHLSDVANRISESYGYWLGDAFASGGSNGYDHKKVGITARGAWVLVRRHFAERGINPYAEPVTVIGIGDMGGDVFGNGLLESPHLRLLAAFNHAHIFLDPDPDTARSYEERKRLFATQGGWDKYDTSILSPGGGVFERRAKSIELSPTLQTMLNLEAEQAEPEEVIRAILKMDVDLLWNGGIGTFVKATSESHAMVDDRSNNALRIDASELQANIVGEGGNLGLSQRARIEAALNGTRLNTDAIDNSGGVDMSDREVNLKVLLNRVVARGELTVEQRNQLLEQMTDEVATLVLADNDAQGRQLSRDILRSRDDIFGFGRAIAFVEQVFDRPRTHLQLPDEKELERRAANGLGLTRPELAVLSAWVKIYVAQELREHAERLPGFRQLLHSYFPAHIQQAYPQDIDQHLLATSIATTVATTRMVADAGAAFFPMVIESTGASVPMIAEAYLKAQRLAQTEEIRGTLEELRDSVKLGALYNAWVEVEAGVREVALYWLSAQGRIPDDALLGEMKDAAGQVYELQASSVLEANAEAVGKLLASDIPEPVASRVMRARYLNIALTVWAEARRAGAAFDVTAVQHLAIGRASRLQEVLDDLAQRPAAGRWEPVALRILQARFHALLQQLVSRCTIDSESRSVDLLETELASGVLSNVRAQVDAMWTPGRNPTVASLLVLEERVNSAISRIGEG